MSFKKKSTNKSKLNFDVMIGIPYIIIMSFLVILPLGILFLYSFVRTGVGFEIKFTFANYINFVNEPLFLQVFGFSLLIAFLTTIFCLIIGYPLAYIIARSNKRIQVVLILLINAPMWINMLLRVRSLQQLLSFFGDYSYESMGALIFGMVYIFLPFMVLPIYTVLSKMDEHYFESSADLGANKFQTFVKVIVPLSLSGIISGVIMVFLPSATTLVVPKYLGPGRHLIGDIIEATIMNQSYGGYGYGAAISIVVGILIMLLVFFMKKVDKYQGGQNETTE